jgi:hypothetical protein
MILAPAAGAENLKIEIKKRQIINLKKYQLKLLIKRANKIRNLAKLLKLDRLSGQSSSATFTTLNSKMNLNVPT